MSVLTPLRVRLPFGSEEEFVAQYGSHVGKDGFFLATRTPKEVGSRLLFDLVLTGGESVLRGEGMVVRTHGGDRPGMTIRFLRLDAAGTDLVQRIVAVRATAPVSHPSAWSPPGGRTEAAAARPERAPTSALPSAWAPPTGPGIVSRAPPPAPPEPTAVEPEDVQPVAEAAAPSDEPLEGGAAQHDEPLTPPLSTPDAAGADTGAAMPGPELDDTSRFGTMGRLTEHPRESSAAAATEGQPQEAPELVVTEFVTPKPRPPLDVHAAITPPAGTPVVRDVVPLPPPDRPAVEPPPPESHPLPYQLDAPASATSPESAEASFREVAEALAEPSVHERPTQPIPLVSTLELPVEPPPEEPVPPPVLTEVPPPVAPAVPPRTFSPAAPGVGARGTDVAPPIPAPAPAPLRIRREGAAATAVLGIELGPEFVRMAWIREGRPEALALGGEGAPLDFRIRLVREPGAPPRVLPHDAPEPALWVGAPLPFLGLRADSPLFRTVARRWPAQVVTDDRGEPAFTLEGGTVGATELIAALLRWLRHRAEELTGRQIARVVLPVPVSFTALQRERLREAAERAGFEGLRLVHAPTAAAMAFAHGRGLARRRIFVWRLGASAFDVAVLAASGDDLDMVAAAGDPSLGGMNFDEQIALTLDKVARTDPALLRKRIGEAEQLKRLLDDPAREEAVLDGGARLARAELEARTSALVERGVLLAREMLRSASLGPDNLDELLLVGGTSRLPHVRRLVEEAVGRPARSDLDVGGAVAQGAAIIGHLLAPGGPKSASRTAVHEVLGVPLEAVAPELGQVRVLERNTRLPAEKTLSVVLGIGVPLEVQLFQGPGKAPDPRSFLGLLRAPVDRAGEWVLQLSLDTDGILHAAATNPSGKRQLLQLQTPAAATAPEPPPRPAEPETPAPETVAPGLLGGLKRLFGRK